MLAVSLLEIMAVDYLSIDNELAILRGAPTLHTPALTAPSAPITTGSLERVAQACA
jgi:hypothetical protein